MINALKLFGLVIYGIFLEGRLALRMTSGQRSPVDRTAPWNHTLLVQFDKLGRWHPVRRDFSPLRSAIFPSGTIHSCTSRGRPFPASPLTLAVDFP